MLEICDLPIYWDTIFHFLCLFDNLLVIPLSRGDMLLKRILPHGPNAPKSHEYDPFSR